MAEMTSYPLGYTKTTDGDGNTMDSYNMKGLIDIPPVPSEKIEGISALKGRTDDILICTCSKSGTHLLYTIIYMLLSGEEDPPYPTEGIPASWMEYIGVDGASSKTSPRLMISHLPVEKMPPDVLEKARIIVSVRNPKDVYNSWFDQLSGLGWRNYNAKWNGFFEMILQKNKEHIGGPLSWLSWSDQVGGWWKCAENQSNVLLLQFEEMVKDIRTTVEKISAFLGINRPQKMYDLITRKCSFENMKRNMGRVGKEAEAWDEIKWREGSRGIFRKGKIGDWKNRFTVAQSERFDEVFQKRCEQVGIPFYY